MSLDETLARRGLGRQAVGRAPQRYKAIETRTPWCRPRRHCQGARLGYITKPYPEPFSTSRTQGALALAARRASPATFWSPGAKAVAPGCCRPRLAATLAVSPLPAEGAVGPDVQPPRTTVAVIAATTTPAVHLRNLSTETADTPNGDRYMEWPEKLNAVTGIAKLMPVIRSSSSVICR